LQYEIFLHTHTDMRNKNNINLYQFIKMKPILINNILSHINMRYLLDKSYISVILYMTFGGKKD